MILQYRRYTQPFKGLFVTLNTELIYRYTIGYMLKYNAKVHSYKSVLIEYYEIVHIYL